MKHMKSAAIMLCLLIGFAAAARAADVSIGYFDTIQSDPAIVAGQTYHLRHNLMFEGESWLATNYWRGALLPINTKVVVVSISRDSMRIRWDGGSLRIRNINNTKTTIAVLAKRMFSPNPVPIEKFGDEMAGNITSGTLVKGMTLEQVIMTRGFPLKQRTRSITSDNNTWTYKTSRYVTETLVISEGKLAEGRNVKQ
jgi:hypothetical protein